MSGAAAIVITAEDMAEFAARGAPRGNRMSREEWLHALAAKIIPHIEAITGEPFPRFRASCSWPARGGLKKVGTVLGQCWQPIASSDATWEIFISPLVDDSREVARILAHELCHAAAPGAGHGRGFAKVAGPLGFTSPWTSTPATEAFWAMVDPMIAALPPYGHGHMTPFIFRTEGKRQGKGLDGPDAPRPEGAPKPQRNRQMKCECETCGYIARTSRKWIEEAGAPHCPKHGQMKVA